jgi:hypothetical protein
VRVIDGAVLAPASVEELLLLVSTAPDETVWLAAERDRLQTEVKRLVDSIAAGVPADAVAPLIRTKEAELRRLEARLRAPRQPRLDHDRLLSNNAPPSGRRTSMPNRKSRGWCYVGWRVR